MLPLIAFAVVKTATLENVADLPTRFNDSRGEVKLVLVLSPTLGTCLRGARIVRKEVLDELVGQPVRTFVVWTSMRPDDTRDAAQRASNAFDSIYVEQFWDPTRSLARQYGKIVDLPSNRDLAYNVYFVHGRTDEWNSAPPPPRAWMHQLGRDERTLDGPTLRELVLKQIEKAAASRPTARGGQRGS